MRRGYILLAVLGAVLLWPHSTDAFPLQMRRDLISVSQPASGSNHTITFTTWQTVPVSGRIVITPEAGAFTIPAALDVTDVDLLVGAVQQTLAAAPGTGAGSAVGVSVTTGTSGSVTFTLNDTDAISGGSDIEIRIGTNATSGTTGDQKIINPGTAGSYDMLFETQTAASATIDDRGTIIAIIDRVGLGAVVTTTPTPGGGGGAGPTPVPTPTPASVELWPAPFESVTPGDLGGTPLQEVAALLEMEASDLSSILIGQYPVLAGVTMQVVASQLGITVAQLQNIVDGHHPHTSDLTQAQFASQTVQSLASYLGESREDVFAALELEMGDVAMLAGVSNYTIYTFLEMDEVRHLNPAWTSFGGTTLGATLNSGGGPVQIGIGGDPYTFVTDQMGNLGISTIRGGDWTFTTNVFVTDTGGYTTLTAYVSLLHEDGTMTQLFSHLISGDVANTPTVYLTHSSQPQFSSNPGDRIVLTYVAETFGGTGPVTMTILYGEQPGEYTHVLSPPTLAATPTPCFRIANFVDGPREHPNSCRVNLYDLSVLFYNWIDIRNRPDTDLDVDGKVFTTDFSILLYWWTG